MIAFLEAKRKKAEEDGEPMPDLPEGALADMTDEQLAAQLARANSKDRLIKDQGGDQGSICQSEESQPTHSSDNILLTKSIPEEPEVKPEVVETRET